MSLTSEPIATSIFLIRFQGCVIACRGRGDAEAVTFHPGLCGRPERQGWCRISFHPELCGHPERQGWCRSSNPSIQSYVGAREAGVMQKQLSFHPGLCGRPERQGWCRSNYPSIQVYVGSQRSKDGPESVQFTILNQKWHAIKLHFLFAWNYPLIVLINSNNWQFHSKS